MSTPALGLDRVVAVIEGLLGEQLPAGQRIGAGTELASLALESIEYSELLITLEDELGVDIDPLPLADAVTIGDLLRLLETSGDAPPRT